MKNINNCTSRILFKNTNLLGTPILAVSRESNLDHFYVYRKSDDINGWDIYLNKPEFIESTSDMTDDEKDELYNLMKDNWETIIDNYRAICNDDCGCSDCPLYNREFPKSSPDYRLLK